MPRRPSHECRAGFLSGHKASPTARKKVTRLPLQSRINVGYHPIVQVGIPVYVRGCSNEAGEDRRVPTPITGQGLTTVNQEYFMLPHAKTRSAPPPARWDQHCLLVLQFPISLQSEVRLSARFEGVKLGLLRNLSRSAPKGVRNAFMSHAAFRFPFAFDAACPGGESQGTPTLARTAQPV